MLLHLKIKNFATIKELEVDFGSGFSILTGETGAENRSSSTQSCCFGETGAFDPGSFREDQAEVEAVLSLKGTEEPRRLLDESGIDADEDLIIRCLLSSQGRLRRLSMGFRSPQII